MIETLFSQASFRALGWTLIHFIWQGALVAALFAGLRLMLRNSGADARYALSCAAMLLLLVLPLATFTSIRASLTNASVDGRTSSRASATTVPIEKKINLSNREAL